MSCCGSPWLMVVGEAIKGKNPVIILYEGPMYFFEPLILLYIYSNSLTRHFQPVYKWKAFQKEREGWHDTGNEHQEREGGTDTSKSTQIIESLASMNDWQTETMSHHNHHQFDWSLLQILLFQLGEFFSSLLCPSLVSHIELSLNTLHYLQSKVSFLFHNLIFYLIINSVTTYLLFSWYN